MDYDQSQTSYTLVVQVADQGAVTALTSTCLANIVLTDINDNTPRFVGGDFSVSIDEGVAIGTSLVQIFAEDIDSGTNSAMTFMLIHDAISDPLTHFSLVQTATQDMAVATINTVQLLDRETISR